jgi:poly(A) polymerase
MALSRERIADELLKLLGLPKPTPTVRIMLERGILKPVLPEIAIDRADDLERLISSEREAAIEPAPLRRLVALLPRDSGVAEEIAVRLRLSNKARKRIACAADPRIEGDPQALAYRLGAECAIDRLLLSGAASDAVAVAAWHVPRLPLTGGALIKRGLPEGPVVARTLRAIEDAWVAAGFPTGALFERLVDDALASAAKSPDSH